ncbi:MAG TPA: VWA domain-containing protein, partial [Woeseiaceae bacterium]
MKNSTAARKDHARLAENILLFCRTLRRAGLPVGTGEVIDALVAASNVGLQRRDDFRAAMRAVLVKDPGHFRLFRQAFQVYFRNPQLLERMMALLLPSVPAGSGDAPEAALRRLLEAMALPLQVDSEDVSVEVDRSATWSNRELLRHRDFEQMTLAEQGEAKELLRGEIALWDRTRTRRFEANASGNRYDLRRSMHRMMRTSGQLLELARKRRIEQPPVLVLICDISGSMSRYSRMFL